MKMFLVLLLLAISPYARAGVYVTSQQLSVSVTTSSVQAISANVNRKYLLIQNRGSASIYVKAASAHSGTEGIEIVAGGAWEPVQTPVDGFYLKSASGTQLAVVVEGN